MVRILLLSAGASRGFTIAAQLIRVHLQVRKVEATQVAAKMPEPDKRHLQCDGDLRLRGLAPKLRATIPDSFVQLTSLGAKCSRAPINLAEAIEYGAANAKFSVVLELNFFPWIVFFNWVDQAEDSGVDQIVEQNLRRQATVNAPSDESHLRQVPEQQRITLFILSEKMPQNNSVRFDPCKRFVHQMTIVVQA